MRRTLTGAMVLLILAAPAARAQAHTMTFFITSVGPGSGADLRGLDGADNHCRQLAEAVGVTGIT
ncbi:MAG TPA: hypothetical protein VFU23_00120, partial [Gemmatimonadales bacterium]|nr:hypothetical protein [Gemmatimonadales bacterium]